MTEITLPAHIFFHLGPIPITDGFLGAVLVTLFMFGIGLLASRKFSLVPTRFQLMLELVTEYMLDLLVQAFHDKDRARAFFPFFMTILLFIAVANQFTLLPFVFELTYEGFDVFRQPTSDLAQPLALGILIFILSNALALRISPLRHLNNFIALEPFFKIKSVSDLFGALVGLGIGLLNIVGEFAKVISIACRLFGNIFAGNVMTAVIIGLAAFTQFIVPIPFLILGVFSGLVQAFVFMLLSVQFVALAIEGAQPPAPEPEAEPAIA